MALHGMQYQCILAYSPCSMPMLAKLSRNQEIRKLLVARLDSCLSNIHGMYKHVSSRISYQCRNVSQHFGPGCLRSSARARTPSQQGVCLFTPPMTWSLADGSKLGLVKGRGCSSTISWTFVDELMVPLHAVSCKQLSLSKTTDN